MTSVYVHLNWGATPVYDRVVEDLMDNGHIQSVGATVTGRKYYQYLKEESNVQYDPLYCVQDIHNNITKKDVDPSRINELEQKYGRPFLWPALLADRVYYEYDLIEQKRMLQGWFDFYINIFEEFDPDLFFTTDVDSAYTWIPFRIAETSGIGATYKHTRIKDRASVIRNPYDRFEDIYSTFHKLNHSQNFDDYTQSKKEAESYVNQFRSQNGINPSYLDQQSWRDNLYTIGKEAVNYTYNYYFGYYKNDFYFSDTPLEQVKNQIGYYVKKHKTNNSYLFSKPNYDEPYVVFTEHLQPEATLLTLAPLYNNQQDPLRDLSRSMPVNWKVYFKVHPKMIGKRSLSYYEQISQMPNVELIHPSENTQELIQNCKMVVTITGTSGLEAILYQKPAMTFGEPSYLELSMAYKIQNKENLSNQIKYVMDTHKHDDQELINYITAVFHNTTTYPHSAEVDNNDVINIISKQIKEQALNFV